MWTHLNAVLLGTYVSCSGLLFSPFIQCPETPDLFIQVVNWFVPSFCMQMYQLSSHWLFSSVLLRVYLTQNSQFEL